MRMFRFPAGAALLVVMNAGAAVLQSAEPLTACALLSRPEIENAFHARVGAGVSRLQTGRATTCQFTGKDGGVISVLVRRMPSEDWAPAHVERMHKNVRTFREVPGIGDRSFLYDMRGAGAALCVFRAGYYIQISVFRMGESSEILPAVKTLAATALSRF